MFGIRPSRTCRANIRRMTPASAATFGALGLSRAERQDRLPGLGGGDEDRFGGTGAPALNPQPGAPALIRPTMGPLNPHGPTAPFFRKRERGANAPPLLLGGAC